MTARFEPKSVERDLIAAIRRGDGIVQPRGSTTVVAGDRLYLIVERDRLDEVERALDVS